MPVHFDRHSCRSTSPACRWCTMLLALALLGLPGAAMANEAGAVNLLQPQVKNMFAAMQAAGQGERFVPMLADFIAGLNGLAPAGSKE